MKKQLIVEHLEAIIELRKRWKPQDNESERKKLLDKIINLLFALEIEEILKILKETEK